MTKVSTFNFEKPVEKSVGKAARSGLYGVCLDPHSSSILAARPGKRLWRASENEVQATLKFNMISPSKFYNNISTLTIEDSSLINNSNFAILTPYLNSVFSWSGPNSNVALQSSLITAIPPAESNEPLFLLNPENALVSEWWNDLGYIADLSISNDKVFLLHGNNSFDVSVMMPVAAEEYIQIQLDNLNQNNFSLNQNAILLKCESLSLENRIVDLILLQRLHDYMLEIIDKEKFSNVEFNTNFQYSLNRLKCWIEECSQRAPDIPIPQSIESVSNSDNSLFSSLPVSSPPISSPILTSEIHQIETTSINNAEFQPISNYSKLTKFTAKATENLSSLGNATVNLNDTNSKILDNELLSFPSPLISSIIFENNSDSATSKKKRPMKVFYLFLLLSITSLWLPLFPFQQSQ